MAAMTVTGCSSSKSESKETTKSTTEAAKDTEVESTSDQKPSQLDLMQNFHRMAIAMRMVSM